MKLMMAILVIGAISIGCQRSIPASPSPTPTPLVSVDQAGRLWVRCDRTWDPTTLVAADAISEIRDVAGNAEIHRTAAPALLCRQSYDEVTGALGMHPQGQE